MSKITFASVQNKDYRDVQRIRQTLKKVNIAMTKPNRYNIEISPVADEKLKDYSITEMLGYKAIIFARFLNNEFVGKELSGIKKEFVDEFQQISAKKRPKELQRLLEVTSEWL